MQKEGRQKIYIKFLGCFHSEYINLYRHFASFRVFLFYYLQRSGSVMPMKQPRPFIKDSDIQVESTCLRNLERRLFSGRDRPGKISWISDREACSQYYSSAHHNKPLNLCKESGFWGTYGIIQSYKGYFVKRFRKVKPNGVKLSKLDLFVIFFFMMHDSRIHTGILAEAYVVYEYVVHFKMLYNVLIM